MTWWTSIIFYLARHSLYRWGENPLTLVGKVVVAALVSSLALLTILAANALKAELDAQLGNRSALLAVVTEPTTTAEVGQFLDATGESIREDKAWADLVEGAIVTYRPNDIASIGSVGQRVPIFALNDPESLGFADSLVFVTDKQPAGVYLEVQLGDFLAEVICAPHTDQTRSLATDRPLLIASTKTLLPTLLRGFTRNVILPAKDLDQLRKIHAIVGTLSTTDERQMSIRSSLPILEEIEKVRGIQAAVLVFATLAAAVVLGLISSALAALEFREDRYVLSLFRSFGVSRWLLVAHRACENALLAMIGVVLAAILLIFIAPRFPAVTEQLPFVANAAQLVGFEGLVLLIGAIVGGLLTALPISLGMRKPIGLVLQ